MPMCCAFVGLQVTVVWDANRLRRSLMLTVLGWASSLHDPATYARSYPVHLPKPATTSAASSYSGLHSKIVACNRSGLRADSELSVRCAMMGP